MATCIVSSDMSTKAKLTVVLLAVALIYLVVVRGE